MRSDVIFEYHYRRRYLDGTSGISSTHGPALARRDDQQALVVDCLLPVPGNRRPYTGRRGDQTVTITPPDVPVNAWRMWLWHGRPMRLLQLFDDNGRCVMNRFDFATPPAQHDGAWYQTDLYLDLFASGDGREYALLDEDELEPARRLGLLSDDQHAGMLTQADELVELLEAGRFTAWLESICPEPFALPPLPAGRAWSHRDVGAGASDGWPV